jgi:hypothetical protein
MIRATPPLRSLSTDICAINYGSSELSERYGWCAGRCAGALLLLRWHKIGVTGTQMGGTQGGAMGTCERGPARVAGGVRAAAGATADE